MFDGAAPLSRGFAWPLRVRPSHLRAEAGHGRGEVQVVDGCVLYERAIACRVHSRGHGPNYVSPVPCIDVVVHDYHELGVHELAKVGPNAEHDSLGVTRVGFLHRYDGNAVGAAFRRQIEVDDFWELLLKQWNEDFVERYAQYGRFVWRSTRVGAVVDGRLAHAHALDGEHRKSFDFVVIAGVIAKRPFIRLVARVQETFEHNFSAGWNLKVTERARGEMCPLTAQQARKGVF